MLTTALIFIWKILLPLLVVIAVLDWLTASEKRRACILHRSGLSQRQIASRLSISRHRVSKALAQ